MCYSCWLGQLCLKQPTADRGGETLRLKKGWKNSKLWLFSWGKNHHWAISIGPVYSGEQFLCAHSPSEEVKGLLFWEKNHRIFFLTLPPVPSWSRAGGLWLLSIRKSSGSGQRVELHSCCCLLGEPPKNPSASSTEPPPAFAVQTHGRRQNGEYHPRAVEAT